MRRFLLLILILVCSLAVTAEDVTFMNNRRQWEELPSETLMRMAKQFELKNQPDSMLVCWTIVANRFDEHKQTSNEQTMSIRAILNCGIMYGEYYQDLFKAHTNLLRAKDLAEKQGHDDILPAIYLSLGNLYLENEIFRQVENQDDCLQLYWKSFHLARQQKQWDVFQCVFISMADLAYARNKLTDLKNLIQEFNQTTIPDSVNLQPFTKQFCTGLTCLTNQDFQQAIITFKQLPNISHTSDKQKSEIEAIVHNILFHLLMDQSRYSEAFDEINTIDRHSKENGLVVGQITALHYYQEYYSRLNDHALADYYELRFLRSRDSIINDAQINNFDKARFLHEIDKMNEEVKELTYKEQTKERILWIVGAFALIALLLLVLLYISRRRIQEGYQRLYKQNVELLAADEERRQSMEAEPVPVAKYSHNQMDEDVMDELWLQIKRVMETSEEIYHDPFGVDQLADLLGAKRNYVSQTINTKTGEAFNVLLTECRIREACRRMNDLENYGNYSVEGIAQSVGYGSRSHFAKLFKAATGVPPSVYMRMCKAGTPPGAPTPS